MLFSKYTLVAILALGQASAAFAQAGSAILWHADLDAARTLAEKEQKLLLVHFYTESCGPCRMLDATVFNQPTVASTVHSQYVPVKLNANEFQATAERFGITRVPTDVIITPKGKVVERMVSPATPMAYIGQMSGIAEHHRQQVGRSFPTAGMNQIAPEPLNSAYAGLTMPTNQNSVTGPTAAPANGMTSNPFATNTTGTAAPQYGMGANVATPAAPSTSAAEQPVTPVAVANPYANEAVAPLATSQPQTPPADSRYAVAAPDVPAVTPQPITDTAPAAQQPVVATAPQLPAGSPKLGFFGYCPVTMKKENRWQRGDARWGCYHRGRTYLFESAAKRDEFLASGDDYAPALSGIDPVLAIDSNTIEEGKQDFGVEYEGRFYLFSNEDNLRKFWSQRDRYATGVRQAMNAASDGRTFR